MKDEIISFELAKKAKKIGFDISKTYQPDGCYAIIDGKPELEFRSQIAFSIVKGLLPKNTEMFIACTQSLLQKWFREKYDLFVMVETEYSFYCRIYTMTAFGSPYKDVSFPLFVGSGGNRLIDKRGTFETYEEALNAGLIEACKILKERKKL